MFCTQCGTGSQAAAGGAKTSRHVCAVALGATWCQRPGSLPATLVVAKWQEVERTLQERLLDTGRVQMTIDRASHGGSRDGGRLLRHGQITFQEHNRHSDAGVAQVYPTRTCASCAIPKEKLTCP